MKRFLGLLSSCVLFCSPTVASAEDGTATRAPGEPKDGPAIREQRSETTVRRPSYYRHRANVKQSNYRPNRPKLPWAPHAPGD